MNDPKLHLQRLTALGLLLLSAAAGSLAIAAPTVSNVHAVQRAGTQLVDITYDLTNPGGSAVAVSVTVSTNGGANYTLPATLFTGAVGNPVTPGSGKQMTWDAGQDWPGHFSANVRFRVTADDQVAPSGMVVIPAGSFTMGDSLDGDSSDLPLHSVYVSAVYMDKYLVTYALWQQVYQWATSHGYSFDYSGSGKAASHPVQSIDWYDCVKWCNARSEMEGRTPAYYTDAGLSVRYRSGLVAPFVNWQAGHRLPTEAEWEKAARGGLSGHRFPWGDTITEAQDNYYSCSSILTT